MGGAQKGIHDNTAKGSLKASPPYQIAKFGFAGRWYMYVGEGGVPILRFRNSAA